MKSLLLIFLASNVYALGVVGNPDRYPSLEVNVFKGEKHMRPYTGYYTLPKEELLGGKLDLRIPMTKSLTFHAGGEYSDINDTYEKGHSFRLETGLKMYFRGN